MQLLVLDPSIGALEWGGSGMVELTVGRMRRSGERAPADCPPVRMRCERLHRPMTFRTPRTARFRPSG